jgi:hypothetical protein
VLLEFRAARRISFFRGRYRLFGIVLDLSMGGLAVEYADRKLRPSKNLEFALSAPEAGLRLEDIRMTPVSDYVLADETDCGGSICRRRGFRFDAMTADQQETLQKILHSSAEASRSR